jgi:hypothetical protein
MVVAAVDEAFAEVTGLKELELKIKEERQSRGD